MVRTSRGFPGAVAWEGAHIAKTGCFASRNRVFVRPPGRAMPFVDLASRNRARGCNIPPVGERNGQQYIA